MRREVSQAGLPDDRHGDLGRPLYAVVLDSTRAALILHMPSERILAASPAAASLLLAEAGSLVGRRLSDLATSPPSEASALLASGWLNGYESRRTLVGTENGQQIDVWLRSTEDRSEAPVALAALSKPGMDEWEIDPAESSSPAVIGAADEQLMLDRVSDNIESLLGYPPGDVLGQSLLHLVAAPDIAGVLFALAQATSSQQGVSLTIRMLRPNSRQLRCQLVLLPLEPEPSCAFALQPAREFSESYRSVDEFRLLLRRFTQGIQAAGTARDLTEGRQPRNRSLAELTARETQIVNRLLAGDRVPAIARQLFLAQSTVRNHLSAVFSKLGVKSQQELIVLLRQAQNLDD
ncbi:MAG: LuxR C-terminal-related transcriptional regulator [Actinomycetota bacterium]|nr:LuxR C-terminal-related transcriptional regulator [Actinomycetota bacterium]MDQ2958325.1 LuxR C-terminal-related transcriptional regulator [Actinomycetota bacterium]